LIYFFYLWHTKGTTQTKTNMKIRQFITMIVFLLSITAGAQDYGPYTEIAQGWERKTINNVPSAKLSDLVKKFNQTWPTDFATDAYNVMKQGLAEKMLDDNTGYIYVPTFENTIGDGNIDEILLYLAPCNKLIIDVRDNGGGLLTQAQKLAARFCQERTLVGYMCHKTGSGHSDFSPREEQWIEPSAGLRWHKPVMVLTNRSVYSAANEYVKYMKCMPYVTVIGDNTGGGSGMPYSSELPNGWGVRYSACPMYDADGGSTEDGVAPDVRVDMEAADVAKGVDTIIEYARSMK
jgi:C-terminal processing protease CtpA/Prc